MIKKYILAFAVIFCIQSVVFIFPPMLMISLLGDPMGVNLLAVAIDSMWWCSLMDMVIALPFAYYMDG